jgi:hypothetical protein
MRNQPRCTHRYCGREFSDEEIEWIRDLVDRERGISRSKLSERFCAEFGWRKPDGGLKAMSCRVAMLRMERDGLIRLPPPLVRYRTIGRRVQGSLFTAPQPQICKPAGGFDLRLEIVTCRSSPLWNEFIALYHYLGYTPLPGAQLRYFVKDRDETVALLGFGAAAWKVEARDRYIGWDAETRNRQLRFIVNNARFLVLPWVRSKNLCSRILSLVARRIPKDWQERYGYGPVLLETFVDKARFSGTCYKAAGWTCVGQTKGRGKLDVHTRYLSSVKTVWVRPLVGDFRQRLIGGDHEEQGPTASH